MRSTAEIEVVSDGERARSRVNGFQSESAEWPDIVLLDINLPKIDGLELLQRLASAPCPIVVMSSSQSPTDRQRALDHGAACYFWKPTDLDGFLRLGASCPNFLHESWVIIVADATV